MTTRAADVYRVAVVGAGPSGLFAAQALVSQDRLPVEVDLYDRLPTPYGLLRYGVAPDHPNIKAVATALQKVFDAPGIRFHGLVRVGEDLSRDEMLSAYDAIVYAVGAAADVAMGAPGEELPGSISARQFVEWYGGHPDASPHDLGTTTGAAVVGLGNVALDVARVLVKDPEALAVTDMPDDVLDVLRASAIDDVWIVGRRGPAQAAFTTKELREILELPGVEVTVNPDAFDGIDDATLDRRCAANVAALREAATRAGHAADGQPDLAAGVDPVVTSRPARRLHFLFWRRPVRLEGTDHVESFVVERTRVEGGRVVGSGQEDALPVQLVLRSIGYRGVAVPGVSFEPVDCVIPNREGRVVGEDGLVAAREYVVGWIKRGPTGVIGTNKSDAAQTVAHLVDDLTGTPPLASRVEVAGLLAARGVQPVSFEDWQRIDAEEVARGQAHGRAREKVATWAELRALVAHEH